MVAAASLRTPQQLADMTGVSLPAVKRHLALADVPHNGAGRYEQKAAEAAIYENVDPARLEGHMERGDGSMTPAVLTRFSPRRESRDALEAIKVTRARLALDRELKMIVPAADVDEAARALVAKLRHAVMAVPKRIASRVRSEGATTFGQIQAIADEECRAALKEAADVDAIIREITG